MSSQKPALPFPHPTAYQTQAVLPPLPSSTHYLVQGSSDFCLLSSPLFKSLKIFINYKSGQVIPLLKSFASPTLPLKIHSRLSMTLPSTPAISHTQGHHLFACKPCLTRSLCLQYLSLSLLCPQTSVYLWRHSDVSPYLA